MFERRLYYHVDWALVAAVFALAALGLMQIYSATGGPTSIYVTQIYGILLGMDQARQEQHKQEQERGAHQGHYAA